jgi:type IVB pilus formation R64 PilN family outer membrane protein
MFKTTPIARVVAVSLVLSSLTGCVSSALVGATRDENAVLTKKYDGMQQQFDNRLSRQKEAVEQEEEVNHPYLVGKIVPLARDVALPLALRKNVDTVAYFPEKSLPLAVLAQRISLATGIAVKIEPDVYTQQALLMPRSESGVAEKPPAQMTGGLGAAPSPGELLPASLRSGSGSTPAIQDSLTIQLLQTKQTPELSQLLDLAANQVGINWEYSDEKNQLRFYRFVTKTWQLPFSGKSQFTTTFQQPTSQTSGGGANGAPIQQTQQDEINKTSQDAIDELELEKKALLPAETLSSVVSSNPATGTITLRDTKDAVENADRILKTDLAILGRVVSLKFQTVTVTLNNDSEAGVDWNTLLTKALSSVPSFSLAMASPATLVSSNAASVGVNLLSGSFAGTSGIVKALRDLGDVSTSIAVPLSVRNRHSTSYTDRDLQAYVCNTTPATATAGGTGGTPGLQTCQVQVGFKLLVYPNATNHNDVYLTLGFDTSVLQALTPFTSGTGANAQTVENPHITGNGVGDTLVPVHNGQTVIVTGFDQTQNQYDKRTLGEHLPLGLGGSVTATKTRTFTLVLMTVGIQDEGAHL